MSCHGSKDGSCHSDLLSPDIPLLHSLKLLNSKSLQQPGKLLGGRVDEELASKQAGEVWLHMETLEGPQHQSLLIEAKFALEVFS